MRKKLVVAVLFMSLRSLIHAQTDSVAFTPEMRLEDGVYLTPLDLRKNMPIKKEQLISQLDKDQLEFIGKVMYEEKFSFRRNDSVLIQPTAKAWGYVQNNSFYVNYKGDFYRVPVFGSISYLVANVTVVLMGTYDPRFGYSGGGTSKELREFLINYYDGSMTEFSGDYFEQLLSRDPALLAEYKNLSKRQRKDQLYMYIRKFNAAHPVYFLK
ncbi:MAG: hypothetical protein PSX36_12350 [bacterium]|nr:hypothetical protein [bacterium]